jgi:hypothetical protein
MGLGQLLTPQRSPRISQFAARLATLSIVTYQILLIVLIFLRPDLEPSWHTISEWAIGSYGWLMSGAFLLSGISYGALTVALWPNLCRITGKLAKSLLVVCTIGAIGVGLFTTDPMPIHSPLTTRGLLHFVCGTSQLALFPFAALFASLSLAHKSSAAWMSVRKPLLAIAGLPLLGFVAFVVITIVFVVPLGPTAYGPGVWIGWPPRVMFMTYAIWLGAVAGLTERSAVQPPTAGQTRGEHEW